MTRTIATDIGIIAAHLADARAQRKLWEDRETELLKALTESHLAGDCPTKFEAAGFSFVLQDGRKTVTFTEEVTAEIKAIQAAAIADGLSTTKQGQPFWRLSALKD